MRLFTKQEDEYIISNYKYGTKACANKLRISYDTLLYRAIFLGIKKSKKGKRNSKIPLKIFTEDFIKESVYILGLIWADGSVRDRKIISSFRYDDGIIFEQFFNKTGQWKCSDLMPTRGKLQRKIIGYSTDLCEFLVKNDYNVKTSASADKILSKIPENLKHYWFRGLFDGDGYITYCTRGSYFLCICSSYEQNWRYMASLCEKLKIKYQIRQNIQKNGNKSSEFCITNKNGIKLFCEYIYGNRENDLIGLNRKYSKWIEIKNFIINREITGVAKSKIFT